MNNTTLRKEIEFWISSKSHTRTNKVENRFNFEARTRPEPGIFSSSPV